MIGHYRLNNNPDYNFLLNCLVNMNGADLALAQEAAGQIHDQASWKSVLLYRAKELDAAGDNKNAMTFFRMAESYMDWDDPDALSSWKRAQELFFEYYANFFAGEQPVVERFEIPYGNYTMAYGCNSPYGRSKSKR